MSYTLCIDFETFEETNSSHKNYQKIQDLTYFGFSLSFLDNNYITPINPDTPYVDNQIFPVTEEGGRT